MKEKKSNAGRKPLGHIRFSRRVKPEHYVKLEIYLNELREQDSINCIEVIE